MTKRPEHPADLPLRRPNGASGSGYGAGVMLAGEGAAPEWVQLFPKGPALTGRDPRNFTLADPNAVLAAFRANKGDLPIDWEHGQDRLATEGHEAPAAGWITNIEIRDGAVWGRVEWTAKGARSVTSRAYRYISPAFLADAAGCITRLVGAALVNRPFFHLPALASETSMDPAILAALSLPAAATASEAVTAIGALKTAPSLAAFVPRADYDAVLARANAADAQIAGATKAAREAEVAALVDGGIAAGKIIPASRDTFLFTARAEGGVEVLKAYLASAASLFTPVVDPGKTAPGSTVQLTAEEREVAAKLGISEAAMLAQKAA